MRFSVDQLNDSQRAAVEHVDGPLLILAGPGSGKTRVVTHRIARLLQHGISPYQILALTFTNKAASEMAQRVESLTPGANVWVSTFHRFGARLLRRYAQYVGLQPNYSIYDTSDSRQVVRQVLETLGDKSSIYTPDRIAAAISSAKNRLITPEEYEPRRGSPISNIVAEVYPLYQKRLLEVSAVDFDDLLMHVALMLYKNPELRRELDDRYRYIMVDEYQDTNRAQYVLLKALSADHPNLAATGDPDQSIYGWRGANLSNILDFEKDFPNVQVVRLEENYRSTKRILAVADALIAHNVQRREKSLYTHNGQGTLIKLTICDNQAVEANRIAQHIAEHVQAGKRRPRDFAIFYRINALSRTLEGALREAGVPFQIVRGQEFFQRKEIKDVLAYAQVINNPRDDLAVLRTINTPPRGIGKRTIERLQQFAYAHAVPLLEAARQAGKVPNISAQIATKVARYVTIMDRLGEKALGSVEELIQDIVEHSGYRKALGDSDVEDDLDRLANIEELITDARQFDVEHPEEGQLEEYLQRTWLVNEIDDWEAESDRVSVMTLHAAKGLEFPVVFVMAIEEGLLPHEKSKQDVNQLEEERRLLFVGITRAAQELYLSYASRRTFRGQSNSTIPSHFLTELPGSELEVVSAHDWQDSLVDHWEDEQVGASNDRPEAPATPKRRPRRSTKNRTANSTEAHSITTAAAIAGEADACAATSVATVQLAEGGRVNHPEYGLGKVLSVSGKGDKQRATINFALAGRKTFLVAHSKLQPVGNRA